MTDIEKRARELLAAEWIAEGWDEIGRQVAGEHKLSESPSLRAIIAALTPPEGFVLVPAYSVKPCGCGCHRYCCVHCGTELGGLAARPEVS